MIDAQYRASLWTASRRFREKTSQSIRRYNPRASVAITTERCLGEKNRMALESKGQREVTTSRIERHWPLLALKGAVELAKGRVNRISPLLSKTQKSSFSDGKIQNREMKAQSPISVQLEK